MSNDINLEESGGVLTEQEVHNLLREAFEHDVQCEMDNNVINECFEEHARMLEEEAIKEMIQENLLNEARTNPKASRADMLQRAKGKAKSTAKAARRSGQRLTPRSGGGNVNKNTNKNTINLVLNIGGRDIAASAQPLEDLGGGKKRVLLRTKKSKRGKQGVLKVRKGQRPELTVGGKRVKVKKIGGGGGGKKKGGANARKRASTKITLKSIQEIMEEWVKVDPESARKFIEAAQRGGGQTVEAVLTDPKVSRLPEKIAPAVVQEPPPSTTKPPTGAPAGTPPPEEGSKREGFLAKTFGFMQKHPVKTGIALGLLGTVALASGFGVGAIAPLIAKVAASPAVIGGLKGAAIAGGANLATGYAREKMTGQKRSWKDRLKSAGKAALGGALGGGLVGAAGSFFGGGSGGTAPSDDIISGDKASYTGDGASDVGTEDDELASIQANTPASGGDAQADLKAGEEEELNQPMPSSGGDDYASKYAATDAASAEDAEGVDTTTNPSPDEDVTDQVKSQDIVGREPESDEDPYNEKNPNWTGQRSVRKTGVRPSF